MNILKITRDQMVLFFGTRYTPPLRMKNNGVEILKAKYFTLMVQEILTVSQFPFLVQNL